MNRNGGVTRNEKLEKCTEKSTDMWYDDAYLSYDNSDIEGTKLKISFTARCKHQVWHGNRLGHTNNISPKNSAWKP